MCTGLPVTTGQPVLDGQLPVIGKLERNLGRNNGFVALAVKRLAQKQFIHQRPVDLGRIKERYTELHGPCERREVFLFIARAVSRAHAHAAEPLLTYDQTLIAEMGGLHDIAVCAEFPDQFGSTAWAGLSVNSRPIPARCHLN
jgi:hypothetical protein